MYEKFTETETHEKCVASLLGDRISIFFLSHCLKRSEKPLRILTFFFVYNSLSLSHPLMMLLFVWSLHHTLTLAHLEAVQHSSCPAEQPHSCSVKVNTECSDWRSSHRFFRGEFGELNPFMNLLLYKRQERKRSVMNGLIFSDCKCKGPLQTRKTEVVASFQLNESLVVGCHTALEEGRQSPATRTNTDFHFFCSWLQKFDHDGLLLLSRPLCLQLERPMHDQLLFSLKKDLQDQWQPNEKAAEQLFWDSFRQVSWGKSEMEPGKRSSSVIGQSVAM